MVNEISWDSVDVTAEGVQEAMEETKKRIGRAQHWGKLPPLRSWTATITVASSTEETWEELGSPEDPRGLIDDWDWLVYRIDESFEIDFGHLEEGEDFNPVEYLWPILVVEEGTYDLMADEGLAVDKLAFFYPLTDDIDDEFDDVPFIPKARYELKESGDGQQSRTATVDMRPVEDEEAFLRQLVPRFETQLKEEIREGILQILEPSYTDGWPGKTVDPGGFEVEFQAVYLVPRRLPRDADGDAARLPQARYEYPLGRVVEFGEGLTFEFQALDETGEIDLPSTDGEPNCLPVEPAPVKFHEILPQPEFSTTLDCPLEAWLQDDDEKWVVKKDTSAKREARFLLPGDRLTFHWEWNLP